MVQQTATRRHFLVGATTGIWLGTATRKGAAQETDRYIVGTRAPSGVDAAERLAERVIRVLDFEGDEQAVVGVYTQDAVDQLRARADVTYVERDGRDGIPDPPPQPAPTPAPTGTPRAPPSEKQRLPWGIDRLGCDRLHADGMTGDGIDVAVIDTGIDSTHPDLRPNLGEGRAIVSCQDVGCNEPWDDDFSHGTQCAGIVAAVDNSIGVVGVGPAIRLHSVKVLGADGFGNTSDIAEGIRWVAEQGYDVASLSLGGRGGSAVMRQAVQYAHQKGVILVAAAGNDSCACVEYPAAFEEVIAASATNQADGLAWFSSYGPEIDLAAPGTAALSTKPGGYDRSFNGTSMACPHVAGAIALLLAGGFSPEEARQRILETAEDVGLPVAEQGNGLVNPRAALQERPSPDHHLVVFGGSAQDRIHYYATVDGTIEKTAERGPAPYVSVDPEDELRDGTVMGEVAGGGDAYEIAGEVETFAVDGDARVYFDGEAVDPATLGTTLPHHLVIVGGSADAPIDYEFSVDDQLTKSGTGAETPVSYVTIDFEDEIDGTTARGVVAGGADAYRFAGEITDGDIGRATAYLDGRELDEFPPTDEPADNHLVVFGGSASAPVHYYATVAGAIEKSADSGPAPYVSVDPEDVISGQSVTGTVAGGGDAYTIDGDVETFAIDGPARVFWNGEEVDPATLGRDLPNHLAITGGSGERPVNYELSVTGALTKSGQAGSAPVRGVTIDSEDEIDGTTATGVVAGGVDAYRFAGDFEGVDADGDLTVYVNGEEVTDGQPPQPTVEYLDCHSVRIQGRAESAFVFGWDMAPVDPDGDGTPDGFIENPFSDSLGRVSGTTTHEYAENVQILSVFLYDRSVTDRSGGLLPHEFVREHGEPAVRADNPRSSQCIQDYMDSITTESRGPRPATTTRDLEPGTTSERPPTPTARSSPVDSPTTTAPPAPDSPTTSPSPAPDTPTQAGDAASPTAPATATSPGDMDQDLHPNMEGAGQHALAAHLATLGGLGSAVAFVVSRLRDPE